ncbi:MAG: hypothetical protein ACXVEE_36170 [Polyangiales bacterium]
MDSAIETALCTALGHPPPFAPSELASVASLEIRGARSLAGLEACASLRRLVVFASEIADAAVIARLPSLAELTVHASTIDDPARVADAPLSFLDLSFSDVEDAEPLTALPALRVLRSYGVPWTIESFDVTLVEWRIGDRGHARPPAIETSAQSHWRAARAMRQAGLRVCFGDLPTSLGMLVRPGIHDGEGIILGYADEMSARAHEAPPSMWEAARTLGFRCARLADGSASRFAGDWTSGTEHDVAEWAAVLAERDRAALVAMAERFPLATFYRESSAAQARAEARIGAAIPAALAAFRRDVLAGVGPAYPYLDVRFDRFDRATPLGDGNGWMTIGLLGHRNSERRALLDEAGLFPIGDSCGESGYLELALDVRDERNPIVYAYRESTLFHERGNGDLRRFVWPAFESYASMLGHIVAVARDGSVVEAGAPFVI